MLETIRQTNLQMTSHCKNQTETIGGKDHGNKKTVNIFNNYAAAHSRFLLALVTAYFLWPHKFLHFKTSFSYCWSGDGQNSVIPVVWMYTNKHFEHNMLHYLTALKSIALCEYTNLNLWKMKMFANTWGYFFTKIFGQIWFSAPTSNKSCPNMLNSNLLS